MVVTQLPGGGSGRWLWSAMDGKKKRVPSAPKKKKKKRPNEQNYTISNNLTFGSGLKQSDPSASSRHVNYQSENTTASLQLSQDYGRMAILQPNTCFFFVVCF